MCYAIPAKLIARDGLKGVVDYFGEKRNILLDLEDIEIGDYLYAQGGISVRKVPAAEAQEILRTWKDIFFELKRTDETLSKMDEKNLPLNVLGVLQQVNLRKDIKKEDLRAIFKIKTANELKVLYELANNIRQKEHGNASCVHGIIEFSNHCTEDCFYCGIRREKKIKRYRMSVEEIVENARYAVEQYGFKALVLQAGEDPWYTDEKLDEIVKRVRELGVLVFLSIGIRSVATYKKLYTAGARAALLRFETSNKEIFEKLRPGTKLEERLGLIKELRKLGYIIATGFLVGLPGATIEDTVNDILMTKALGADMYSFGPFLPAQGTPLAGVKKVTKEDILRIIAITRLADANSNILVTTAMETLDKSLLREGLLAGGNSLMINITPRKYKELYTIYDNKADVSKDVKESVDNAVNMLFSLGRAPTDLGVIVPATAL